MSSDSETQGHKQKEILNTRKMLTPRWHIWCFQIVVLGKTLESPLDSKEIKPVNPKPNQPWIFTGRTVAEAEAPILYLATWCEEPTHWKSLWCWGRLKVKGEGDGRMKWLVTPTQWSSIWANSRKQWRTEEPGMLQSLGSQSQRWLSDWTTT